MSTDLSIISGEYEYVKSVKDRLVGYRKGEIFLTSFYGGVRRGTCLQISVVADSVSTIQLTREKVIELRDVLNDWLD